MARTTRWNDPSASEGDTEVGLRDKPPVAASFHRCAVCKRGFWTEPYSRPAWVECPHCEHVQSKR